MMSKIKSVVMSKPFLIGIAAGVVIAIAFRRFIPAAVTKVANALPGSDAKAGA